MRLRRNQLCPIHRSHFCCGREAIPREKRARQMGIRRIEDPQHPARIPGIRSNGEMRKLLDRKIAAQNGICALCKKRFTDYSDIVPDHINPRGMGGAWRDDHPGQHSGCPLVVQRRKGFKQGCDDGGIGRQPTPLSRFRIGHFSGADYLMPTRSKIIRARFTLSDTTAVRRGDGRLISGSRARRTAAMIAAAMTSVDFIRVCSCIFSAQASRSRAIARFISPISAPLIARA